MPPNLQYIRVDDFRQGIITLQRSAGTDADMILPPGAANLGTVNCYANQTGQLVPLPKGSLISSIPNLTPTATPKAGSTPQIIGLLQEQSTGIGGSFGFIHVLVEILIDSAGSYEQIVEWWVLYPTLVWTKVRVMAGGVNAAAINTFRFSTMVRTRGKRSAFSTPGPPIVAAEWTSAAATNGNPNVNGATMFYEVFPDPNALGVDSTYEEFGVVNNGAFLLGGPLVAHSGRILRLCETTTAHGAGVSFYSNERVRFTDPPNSVQLTSTATDTVLDEQFPGGYGSWGSISFGELLIIKDQGGALLVEGDVYAPQITRLPGVVSTAGMQNPASFSSAGLIYVVNGDGAYMWNGGDTSRKINKVSDELWFNSAVPAASNSTRHTAWSGDLVAFANGWLYDTVNDAWWNLSSPLTGAQPIALVSADGSQLLVGTSCLPKPATTKTFEFAQWTKGFVSDTYTWVSQTIPVSTYQTIDIHEITLCLSNIQSASGGYVVTVTLSGVDGTSSTETISIPITATDPVYRRIPIGYRGNNINVTITVASNSNTIAALTLDYFNLGYVVAGPYGQST